MTAGSVGAIAAPTRPDVVHEKPSSQCAARATIAGGRERARNAERAARGPQRRSQAAQADPRAAVEEDDDERDDADPLDGPDLELSPSEGKTSESTAAATRKIAGPGHADALAEPARQHREREARRNEEHDQPEVVHLVHRDDARENRGSELASYSSLTFL